MTRRTRLHFYSNRSSAAALAILLLASAASAQTRIELHKNRYSPEQDVKLGREAAAEVRRQLPMLDDERTDDFIDRIGDRLIGEIPDEYRQPAFRYSFDVVNLREINAFALPGGPMFVHRGMIEAARTEGEVAGVMAHELAHVILRHGTAQATRGQGPQIGAVAGQILGAILGGRTGAVVAQGSELVAGGVLMKYSREFEREADLFGAQLMARAGYNPRQMATMFETIQRQSGSRGPEWLSSHPDPGNRAQAINREAEMLTVDGAAGSNGDLQGIHARLKEMSPAPTMAQVSRQQRSGTAGAGREPALRVEPPSSQWRRHQPGNLLRLSVPANWGPIDGEGTVRYAPDGGVVRGPGGQTAFTHGIEVGVVSVQGNSLEQQTEALLRGFAQANPQLRRSGGYSRTNIGGRQGLSTTLTNVSEVTGSREAVNVSTARLRDGRVLFLIGVAPANEAGTYLNAFGRVRQSIELADGQ
jgi:Zn-dependent protease with chaperone function